MRECEGYRDMIEALTIAYPGRVALSISDVAKALGIDRRTVQSLIKKDLLNAVNVSKGKKNTRYAIPITSIAKFMTQRRSK